MTTTNIIQSFRRLQEQAPDFIVCTGDWITYHDSRQLQQLQRVLAHMPQGRLGTIGIMGNHDYGRRWSELDVADEVTRIAREAGVTLLRNQSVTCARLQFIGLDDFWSPCFDPIPVLAQTNQQTPGVVLCHNPDAADQPVWGNYQGWILAGHTHGGQCKPPFLPPPELPVKNRRYTASEIPLSGNRRLYISRGVGHLLRVRFNARPEIPVFRLQSAAAMSPIPAPGKS